jgi:putative PIN family toxin of toxin-antitoxin system
MNEKTRVVFDCNTFLQALSSPDGPAGNCVQLALSRQISLFVSPQVLRELREVSARPKVIAKLKLIAERVEEFMEAIELAATLLDRFPLPFEYARDPDDAHYVNLALAASARLIVSRDRDLLELTESASQEALDFRGRFPELRVLTPVQFLQEQRSGNKMF